MRIYGNCWHQRSACQYYRLRVPIRAMQKLGIADGFQDDPFQDQDRRGQSLWTSDIQLHYLVAGKAIHAQCLATCDMQPKPNLYGETQYPPVIVYDMDDDIEVVTSEYNSGYGGLFSAGASIVKSSYDSELGHYSDEDDEGAESVLAIGPTY